MHKITKASAYANNEVAFIAWAVDGVIDGCLGFDIVRVRLDGSEPKKGLATWVPFPGQENPDWKPQDTGVWPIQKLFWRDLTLRKHRDDTGRRDVGFTVKYEIRPVGELKPGMEAVPVRQEKTYSGPTRPLGYLGKAVATNDVTIDLDAGGVRATFTNGILSGQWLKHAIEEAGKTFSKGTIKQEIADRKSPIRAYLTGDVLDTVSLMLRDKEFKTGKIRLALYELGDEELVDILIKNKDRIEVILSNSSKSRGGDAWDSGNAPARKKLKREGVVVHDRMFNNSHIGHNKFAVWLSRGKPKAVMSGSTNWTPTGLCGQSNNAFVIRDDNVADAYNTYWEDLLADKFPSPKPATASGKAPQVQGADLRKANGTSVKVDLVPASKAEIWFSPNTKNVTKGKAAPADLVVLFDLMMKAKQAIFFLAFLPSRAGADSIIATAVKAGAANTDLYVVGAISDVSAMPGFVPADKKTGAEGVKPYTFDQGGTHIVRATALDDPIGDFEAELLSVGTAIVHDKIVVIDPLSDRCVVAAGSHNLGFKASYENDENLMIFRGNKALAQAYAVHALDVYDHYKFRAWQRKLKDEGKDPQFDGHLETGTDWLTRLLRRKDISRYFV